jgi:hypothetical protein
MLGEDGASRCSWGAEVKMKQALESRRFLRGVDACTVAGSRPDVTNSISR